MNSIGNRIKQARHRQGLSQVELADIAKVSQPTVANWETDSHIPRQAALDKLANILGTSANWIRSGEAEIGNGYHSPAGYLARPVQHVPISAWPSLAEMTDGQINPSQARDYIAISLEVSAPFALLANDPAMAAHFPVGAAIVFDADAGVLQDGKCYLFEREGDIILRRWQSSPDRLEALPNQSAIDADFLETRPTPLARALMSVRRALNSVNVSILRPYREGNFQLSSC